MSRRQIRYGDARKLQALPCREGMCRQGERLFQSWIERPEPAWISRVSSKNYMREALPKFLRSGGSASPSGMAPRQCPFPHTTPPLWCQFPFGFPVGTYNFNHEP